MERIPVNPVAWSTQWGFHQGEIVVDASRTLHCSGQTATDDEGTPQHEGDVAAQLALSLANLESVLAAAQMELGNLVRLNVYTTSIDELMPHYGVLAGALARASVAPPTTMLEVVRLVHPGLVVELEATAIA